MDHKLSIAERLAGSIQLDDQKLIDEIIESEIWNDDDDDDDNNEATAIGNEKHPLPTYMVNAIALSMPLACGRAKILGRATTAKSALKCVISELTRSLRE